MTWGEKDRVQLSAAQADIANLEPNVQEFTSSGTWTKPSNAEVVDIILVGGGDNGSGGSAGAGGDGGNGGEIIFAQFKAADLPATLTITIGAGGIAGSSAPSDSKVTASGVDLMWAACSVGPIMGAGSLLTAKGTGGVGAAGGNGRHSRFGPGGAGGSTAPSPGFAGRGYGAGGGGGRNSSGASSGGGGGGGGYGTAAIATNGSTFNAGNGAPGYCLITTRRSSP